jgi:hypothetical protein
VSTVAAAIGPAWGNPFGLKFQQIGEMEANLFVTEFGSMADRGQAIAGSPWIIGKYSILLQIDV